MKTKLIESGDKYNLVCEWNEITGPAGVLVLETKDGNMIANFTNDYDGEKDALKEFNKLESEV